MEDKNIKVNFMSAIICIILVILCFVGIYIIFNKKENSNNISIEQPIINDNNVVINNAKDEINTNIKNEDNIEGMEEVFLAYGLNVGNKDTKKVLIVNNECFVPIKIMEEILGDNVKISYNNNIIKIYYNISGYEELNTFFTMNIEDGIMHGKTMSGEILDDKKIDNLPIIQNEEVFLPLKSILDRLESNKSKIYYENELKKIRLSLEDFEVDFLNDFPYAVKGGYVGYLNGYYDALKNSKNGLIFKKANKYGLVNYSVEEYSEENNKPKAKYIGYNILADAIYDNIEYNDYLNLYILYKDNKTIIYNINNQLLSDEYDLFEKCYDNFYKIKNNDKYGLYGFTEIIYDDIWYEETAKNSSEHLVRTNGGIFGLLNGKKVLIKETRPVDLLID